MLGYAKSSNVPPAAFAAALPVLATIARRRLVTLPPGFHVMWGLPLMQHSPTAATVDFLAAAVQSGQDSATDGAGWQGDLLAWLRTAAPAEVAPAAIAASVTAILKLSSGEEAGDSSGSGSCGGGNSGCDFDAIDATISLTSLGYGSSGYDRWWHWWQEDGEFSRQLAGIIRGAAGSRATAPPCLLTLICQLDMSVRHPPH